MDDQLKQKGQDD